MVVTNSPLNTYEMYIRVILLNHLYLNLSTYLKVYYQSSVSTPYYFLTSHVFVRSQPLLIQKFRFPNSE